MKQKTKRQLKSRTKILLRALAVLVALALVWGFAIEPELLTVSHIEFADARLPKDMDGVKIVFISDVHVGPFYPEQDVERMAAKIAALQPDMVLFGGDMVEHEENAVLVDRARVAKAFAALKPRLGKYAILGNHDIISAKTQEIAEEILKDGGFTLLENTADQVEPGFTIAGTMPWPMEGENSPRNHSDVGKVAYAAENNAFCLLLAHEPSQIRKDAEHPFALQLSGHTHGGQVAIPFTGRIFKMGGQEIFEGGFFKVKDTTMYVSRGIGTSVVRVRFGEPPEIVVLTLRSK
jgi:uncharacterized protein